MEIEGYYMFKVAKKLKKAKVSHEENGMEEW